MHDKSHRDLEKNKDISMPGSTSSQGNQSGVRRDNLESSEVGASSSSKPGSSRTGSSSSSDLGSRSSSSSSDVGKNS